MHIAVSRPMMLFVAVAGALLLTGCESRTTTAADGNMVEANAMESSDMSMNDMTSVDGSMSNDAMMDAGMTGATRGDGNMSGNEM